MGFVYCHFRLDSECVEGEVGCGNFLQSRIT